MSKIIKRYESELKTISKQMTKLDDRKSFLLKRIRENTQKNCSHSLRDNSYVHPHNGDYNLDIFCTVCGKSDFTEEDYRNPAINKGGARC